MPVTKEDKMRAKLRKAVVARNDVRKQLAELGEEDKKLGKQILELLETLGERETTKLFPKLDGFRVDRPEKTVINEENLAAKLKEIAPKVHKLVFKRVTVFDRKAFDTAVDAGDIPEVDEILSNDDFVRFEPMSPRLMPSKAKTS